MATQITMGKLAAFRPAGSFQARCQRQPGGRAFFIWARYVGDSPSDLPIEQGGTR
jgi:hypothetical protein